MLRCWSPWADSTPASGPPFWGFAFVLGPSGRSTRPTASSTWWPAQSSSFERLEHRSVRAEVGVLGAMQIPVVGLQPLRSVEQPLIRESCIDHQRYATPRCTLSIEREQRWRVVFCCISCFV